MGAYEEIKANKEASIIFHGSCLGCLKQVEHGLIYCRGCQYYDAIWTLPDLSTKKESKKDKLKNKLKEIISEIDNL